MVRVSKCKHRPRGDYLGQSPAYAGLISLEMTVAYCAPIIFESSTPTLTLPLQMEGEEWAIAVRSEKLCRCEQNEEREQFARELTMT